MPGAPAVNGSAPAPVLPKDGVMWPDADTTPVSTLLPLEIRSRLTSQAEKRAQHPRYRYTSPGLDGDDASGTKKRKAAEDFL